MTLFQPTIFTVGAAMKRILGAMSMALLWLSVVPPVLIAQSIDQKLLVVQNDGTLGGNFRVAIQVKGTSLPVANTLGSATIDVQFDNTKLTYVNATNFAYGSAQGYTRSANNNTTYIRWAVTGGGVNENGGGDPPGFDIGTVYATWVQLNFTIANASGSISLTINNATNAIGLFQNHQNEPNTAIITNQTLSAPININNEPLPIQLSSFTATVVSGSQVRLNWATVSETNNYGFEVQKSRDTTNNYQTIPNSFVPGHGTTNEPHSYSFVDNTASTGMWFYRLRQIDLDGSVHFTEGIQVDVLTGVSEKPLPKEFALDQNYPNPFNPSTNIEYAVPRESRVQLEVYNLLGQRVATLVDETKPAGYYTASFNAVGFSSGLYFYRMTAGETSFLKKMMLVK
jgi:hypothetical protein